MPDGVPNCMCTQAGVLAERLCRDRHGRDLSGPTGNRRNYLSLLRALTNLLRFRVWHHINCTKLEHVHLPTLRESRQSRANVEAGRTNANQDAPGKLWKESCTM